MSDSVEIFVFSSGMRVIATVQKEGIKWEYPLIIVVDAGKQNSVAFQELAWGGDSDSVEVGDHILKDLIKYKPHEKVLNLYKQAIESIKQSKSAIVTPNSSDLNKYN